MENTINEIVVEEAVKRVKIKRLRKSANDAKLKSICKLIGTSSLGILIGVLNNIKNKPVYLDIIEGLLLVFPVILGAHAMNDLSKYFNCSSQIDDMEDERLKIK